MSIWWWLLLAAWAALLLIGWALCKAASDADDTPPTQLRQRQLDNLDEVEQ